jgi:AraC-like DNA-binding protein
MILAPIEDRKLRQVVRRAALPEEDVLHRMADVAWALDFGYPRLLACRSEDQRRLRGSLDLSRLRLPVLAIRGATRWGRAEGRSADGFAILPVDEASVRLRNLMEDTADSPVWVEALFADLVRMVGRPLPPELRGLSRRVLEFPAYYASLNVVAERFGLTSGALKARFRRRDLPSPSRYLRWCRLLAAAHILSDPEETVLSASFRMGFASDGNFCRWITAGSGLNPSGLRGWDGRLFLLVRFAEECLSDAALEQWMGLRGLFLRDVA